MNHEDELSFHESGDDVPTWAIVGGLTATGLLLILVLSLILGAWN